MISYNVFFSPGPGVEESAVAAAAHRLMDELKAARRIAGYRILRVTDPASFAALPGYQAIVDFATQADLKAAFAFLAEPGRMHGGAHGELIRLVTDFKVSFTADA